MTFRRKKTLERERERGKEGKIDLRVLCQVASICSDKAAQGRLGK